MIDSEFVGLSPEEKTEKLFDSMFSTQGVNFISGAAEKSYLGRAKRLKDAIQLKVPDRVPVFPTVTSFAAFYSGMTLQEVMYDAHKACRAVEKYSLDFEPDAADGFLHLRSLTTSLIISNIHGLGPALLPITLYNTSRASI